MVIKIYISGISANKEVKKRQQRVMMILDSKLIPYEAVDITEPGREDDREFMKQNSKSKEDVKFPWTPQIFSDETYCGDYDEFDMANETDVLEGFLKMSGSAPSRTVTKPDIPAVPVVSDSGDQAHSNAQLNGVSTSRESSTEKEQTANKAEERLQEGQKQDPHNDTDDELQEVQGEDPRVEAEQEVPVAPQPDLAPQQEDRQPGSLSPAVDEGIEQDEPEDDQIEQEPEPDRLRVPNDQQQADSQEEDEPSDEE